jgi:hypothetical protein
MSVFRAHDDRQQQKLTLRFGEQLRRNVRREKS